MEQIDMYHFTKPVLPKISKPTLFICLLVCLFLFTPLCGAVAQGVTEKMVVLAGGISLVSESYLKEAHFDLTNSSAVFQGNYFGRIGANLISSNYLLNTSNSFNTGNFTIDNFYVLAPTTVDLATTFVGVGSANISRNSSLLSVSLLASGSPLLSGAKTAPSGLEQTTYIGAFDASNNWAGRYLDKLCS
jgi:hypothetical protein